MLEQHISLIKLLAGQATNWLVGAFFSATLCTEVPGQILLYCCCCYCTLLTSSQFVRSWNSDKTDTSTTSTAPTSNHCTYHVTSTADGLFNKDHPTPGVLDSKALKEGHTLVWLWPHSFSMRHNSLTSHRVLTVKGAEHELQA